MIKNWKKFFHVHFPNDELFSQSQKKFNVVHEIIKSIAQLIDLNWNLSCDDLATESCRRNYVTRHRMHLHNDDEAIKTLSAEVIAEQNWREIVWFFEFFHRFSTMKSRNILLKRSELKIIFPLFRYSPKIDEKNSVIDWVVN